MPELLTPDETAQVLRTTAGSLASLRYRGGGPAFRKLGRRVLYARADLDAYVARTFSQTTEY